MALSKAAWAEIRRAYEAGNDTVAAISARYAISQGAIYRRCRLEGWARRSRNEPATHVAASQNKPVRRKRPAKGAGDGNGLGRRKRRASGPSSGLIKRLYNAIDSKLKRLEARMEAEEDVTAADSERETRELGLMIRSFEKVTAFATAIEGRQESQGAVAKSTSRDAERLREEIAERLERLSQDRDAQREPGSTE